MSRLRVFRQTGWFIAGLMTGLPATAAPAEASSMAGVAVAVATTTPPDATATLQAIQSCRRESAALERLDCYDRLLAPLSPSGFDGALVKAGFVGEAWTRATEQEKRREGNTTELLVTQVPGERPTVVITTPAIGHVPPRPVLMFSCVDNITRMQVALMHPLDVHDIAVTLNADNRALRSHWFVRENGTLLESSRGLSGIDEIKQLFGAKTLTVDTVRGFIAGIACSVAVASALWWWQVYPVQQQLLQVNDTAQGAATVWMASPELENYERRLQQLLDTSPVQPLETGMQMMRVADSRWPESLQQQQASTQWNEALKTRAQSSPQLRGWLQTRQDLHAFADLVMQREKEGLTLSYIKNVIWQAERGLGQETPVESLLTQYHDARAQKQNTDALEKQINERLEGVLSRWLLLKNNVMPEAATGTTAEK
ncbi:type VI secretion system-associated protein TagO [Escherichia coli]|nr:type VI secretion system-associated protein TagO [Escherichia coli]EGJ6442159.1 type VI secretion system-associated protein TagO [Escherichia coli]MBI0627725.1 type VI secretion system-associated protein TagO [Escherichia coli]